MERPTPLGEINIADSRFLGFCFPVESDEEAQQYQNQLKESHPDAAHIPVIWFRGEDNKTTNKNSTAITLAGGKAFRWDEDGEPPGSTGPPMAVEAGDFFSEKATEDATQRLSPKRGIAVAIVRYFGNRLLGVTCGRLSGCYRSILKQTLHRFFFPGVPMVVDFGSRSQKDIYGMGAGDCELVLDLVKDDPASATATTDDEASGTGASLSLEERILSELEFDGMTGAAGEGLPRLQNLQADLTTGFIPIYRYPGNYTGDEWTTFEWSPTSLQLKRVVEERLKPLVDQTMNHCVTNYYRDGKDNIAHHGDKDLDLNREGVIVSVSLGEPRTMELRRRLEPRDVIRVALPHCSMLVLGPNTNREWTHSILPKEESGRTRVSLTMRDVKTFRDVTTGRLFGGGAQNKTLEEIRTRAFLENSACFAAFCALSTSMVSKRATTENNAAIVGAFVLGIYGLRLLSNATTNKREERFARDFFTKNSLSGTKY
mmetsp:Transcript_109031/g.222642  ORF Transcript_109031/g.222642 Transcript_109031/m.222642 type:complete len:485 (+) Transcript_109031:122-1576(+)